MIARRGTSPTRTTDATVRGRGARTRDAAAPRRTSAGRTRTRTSGLARSDRRSVSPSVPPADAALGRFDAVAEQHGDRGRTNPTDAWSDPTRHRGALFGDVGHQCLRAGVAD